MLIRDLRQTRTFAVMDVSRAAFDEIRSKLVAAGYQHAIFHERGVTTLDMHGIGLEAEEAPPTSAGSEGRTPEAGEPEVGR